MSVRIRDNVLTGFGGMNGGEYTTPEGVTVVGGGSPLDEYTGPDTCIISEGVTEIGASAFFLSGVDTLVLPESLVRVGNSAFSCAGIRHYSLPDKPIAVGQQAFYGYPTGGVDVTIRRADEKGGDITLVINMGEYNWDHNGFGYLMKMIFMRDFSQNVKTRFKNPVVAKMCLGGIPEAGDYVKRGINRIVKSLCTDCMDGYDGEALAVALIGTGKFVTKKNIDKLTETAYGREAVLAALDRVRGTLCTEINF